jgi:hypothetical protein
MSSSPPAKTPRRSKPSLGARLRRYWIPAVVIAAALIAAVRFAVRAPMFATLTPSVSGNVKVPAAEVIAKAALDPQANVWLVDAGAVERRVEAIPYVASARLWRGFPGGARIEISERKPDACVGSDVALVTIDAARRTIARGLDIGTTKTCAVVAQYIQGDPPSPTMVGRKRPTASRSSGLDRRSTLDGHAQGRDHRPRGDGARSRPRPSGPSGWPACTSRTSTSA